MYKLQVRECVCATVYFITTKCNSPNTFLCEQCFYADQNLFEIWNNCAVRASFGGQRCPVDWRERAGSNREAALLNVVVRIDGERVRKSIRFS